MPKQKLFDEESEEEVSFKTENEYSKKYDKWREREELHKLEQKYGSKGLNSDASLSSDSEDESDEPPEVTEETETQFLKTLALLKTKDPRIYDPNFKCFDEEVEKEKEEKPKAKTLTFEDSDEDVEDDGDIFKIEKKAEIGNTESEAFGEKSSKKASKETKLKEFLTGKAEHINDEVEKELAPLKALWSDPKLNEGEAFLRDYILNKKYLEEGDVGEAEDKIRDDEDLEADEKLVEEQGKFERAYNFRFEEPDEEYLKRFPRTLNYIRPKDDRRSRKRAEVRARKEEEKKRKMEEIARLKALKLKEIQEKIAKIKEVTGNEDLAFKEEDIEGDFDPEEHDRRMRALFDEHYYGEADQEKPVFPDLDEELEIENWENYEHEYKNEVDGHAGGSHCEDEEFNMDADYDPKQARKNLLEELKQNMGKKRRNRKKKSKLAELLSMEKPKFVPTVAEKTYSEYMEEYYKMDCEDIIGGDLPTRFKYRQVVPNDFGLSVEEILLADDKELTQWVPLKKIVKHRPADVEKGEIKTYATKAADVSLKKKVLPSLFKDLPEEPEIVVPVEEVTKRKKKKKKKHKNKDAIEENSEVTQLEDEKRHEEESVTISNDDKNVQPKKKHKIDKFETETSLDVDFNINTLNSANKVKFENNETHTEGEAKKKKNKGFKNKGNSFETENPTFTDKHTIDHKNNIESNELGKQINSNKKKKENKELKNNDTFDSNQINVPNINNRLDKDVKTKKKEIKFVVENINQEIPSQSGDNTREFNQRLNLKRKLVHTDNKPFKKKKKCNKKLNNFQKEGLKKKYSSDTNPLVKLSDERLKAYGLNPKKYKKFMKYKKF